MDKPYLLHMLTPAPNLSPFDVNMAYDAGWDAAVGYTGLGVADVAGMVQDAIFSRGPKGVRRTGLFIGGRDIGAADDMLRAARQAMVSPFQASLMADPSGAYTTAAALVAKVEQALIGRAGSGLEGRRVLVFGGTGPVGATAAVLAARCGARAAIVGHDGRERAAQVAQACAERWQVEIGALSGADEAQKRELLGDAEVVLATAKAGVQVISRGLLESAERLQVAADINAVPPSGIAGIEVTGNASALACGVEGAVGFGALAVGDLKYRTQHALLQRMRAEPGVCLDFNDAFEWARAHA